MLLLLLACRPEPKDLPVEDTGANDTACTRVVFWSDADGDGYGDPDTESYACRVPSGEVANGTDCNDENPDVHPGATEVCDGVDDDCDGTADPEDTTWYTDADGDGYGDPATAVTACRGEDGAVADGTDCDDADATVNPGAEEACDLDDDDCDGVADLGEVQDWHPDTDGDGYGHMSDTLTTCAPPEGYVLDDTDCRPGDAEAFPGAAERCNDDDDDCDGETDEDFDLDADGHTSSACADGDDCDDADPATYPDAPDTCGDGLDTDCDGVDSCGWYGNWAAGSADVQVYGTSASGDAGLLSRVGDVDDDGVNDLVATAPITASIGGGYVVPGPVTSGSFDTLGYRISGSRDLYYAGRSLGVGDLDGDGAADVAWGAPYGTPTGVFVTRGPITGDLDLEDADLSFQGSNADTAGHGADVADVTGDGAPDMVIGAYYADDAAINSGSVYIFEGPVGIADHDNADADVLIASDVDSELVGRFLRAGRDMDGDGIGDLLVGAPYISGGAPGGGGAYVVIGPHTDSVFADAAALLLGPEPNGLAGLALAQGDVDGDGLADALVSSYDRANTGFVAVVLSPASGEIDLSTADILVEGDAADQYAGSSLSAGDVDADGDDEILIGGSGDATSGRSAGAAWLFMQPSAGTWSVADADATFTGDAAGDELGGGVDLEDLTGDGKADVLLGAPSESTGARAAGSVYVFETP